MYVKIINGSYFKGQRIKGRNWKGVYREIVVLWAKTLV